MCFPSLTHREPEGKVFHRLKEALDTAPRLA